VVSFPRNVCGSEALTEVYDTLMSTGALRQAGHTGRLPMDCTDRDEKTPLSRGFRWVLGLSRDRLPCLSGLGKPAVDDGAEVDAVL
jgi:hypothetical protein